MATDEGENQLNKGSVTSIFGGLRAGDPESARRLWERYFTDLVRLARSRLRDAPRGAADEEDVALDAFDSFVRGVQEGRFPVLSDRHDLWRILITITGRKALKLKQHEHRLKRGGGRVISEAVQAAEAMEADGVLSQAPGREPSPELAALVLDEYRRLFHALPDVSLRLVSLMRLEGYTDEEIASSLYCSVSTVERRLRLIRTLWNAEE